MNPGLNTKYIYLRTPITHEQESHIFTSKMVVKKIKQNQGNNIQGKH